MNADRIWIVAHAAAAAVLAACVLLAPWPAGAQGYAGLGTEAEGYAGVVPGRDFDFPADHAPHPGHRIEWWYVTANLEAEDGRRFGAQWTLFRQAVAPGETTEGWEAPVVWMAHAGLTTADDHRSAEIFARGGVGQAGVELGPFRAWIDDWALAQPEDDGRELDRMAMTARGDDFALDLDLTAEGPFVLQGELGYSQKSQLGQASYYYSNPFLAVEGAIEIDGERIAVTGRAWMDREWSSQPLADTQTGWDWFALHLPGGEKLMVYRLRHEDGDDWHASSWIEPSGALIPLTGAAIELEPLERVEIDGRQVPVRWEIALPSRDFRVTTTPLNPLSWMETSFEYWEGPISFEGTHDGVGYLEMTGW